MVTSLFIWISMIFKASTKDMAILDASAHGKVCEKYKYAVPPQKMDSLIILKESILNT